MTDAQDIPPRYTRTTDSAIASHSQPKNHRCQSPWNNGWHHHNILRQDTPEEWVPLEMILDTTDKTVDMDHALFNPNSYSRTIDLLICVVPQT